MIAYLKGRLVSKEPTHVIIEVQGIGYHVHISLNTFGNLKDKEDCLLYTYLHIREDAHTLFGFLTEAEKIMFLNLLSINGVGPSTALMVQSSLNPAELHQAIVEEDVRRIRGVKGIGEKTAQRIILELKDRLKKEGHTHISASNTGSSHNTLRSEALTALTTLGINRQVAEKSVDAILKNSGNTITLEELIKLALKNA
ncbi:MAG TPA: Holliday junction branch migration protein RuvA [Cyclobacteriaceae bacterium]|nr:Holliday junction branch migration protein RuvA [Cyclobacteriaceae bacterium]